MDFCEEERYAAAALFTLALHSTQVDAGAGKSSVRDKATSGWGEPSPQVLDRFLEGRVKHPELDGPAWDAFWGWDCCGPNGLLDRVYQQLDLPDRTWAGLKKLPEVAYGDSFNEFMDLVRTYMAVLDTSLPFPERRKRRKSRGRSRFAQPTDPTKSIDEILFGQVARTSSKRKPMNDFKVKSNGHIIIKGMQGSTTEKFELAQPAHKELRAVSDDFDTPPQRAVHDELFNDLIESGEDSDLEVDLQRARIKEEFEESQSPLIADVIGNLPSSEGSSNNSNLSKPVKVSLFVKSIGSFLEGDSLEFVRLQLEVSEPAASSVWSTYSPNGSVTSEAPPDPKSVKPPILQPEPSQKALAAMWELLEGCLLLAIPELGNKAESSAGSVTVPDTTNASSSQLFNPSADEIGGTGALVSESSGLLSETAERSDCAVSKDDDKATALSTDKKAAKAATTTQELEKTTDEPLKPQVRWYDARARTALKRLAQWLNVSWSKVRNFEALLAYQLQSGERQRPQIQLSTWDVTKRWARVGAIALAGGGAFALVGGLVMAPALVLAIGPTIAFFGGTGGVGISTFFASTAGVAAVTSGMGALGLADTGARSLRMTQYHVNEFGFLEVVKEEIEQLKPLDVKPDSAPAASDSGTKGDTEPSTATGGESEASSSSIGAASSLIVDPPSSTNPPIACQPDSEPEPHIDPGHLMLGTPSQRNSRPGKQLNGNAHCGGPLPTADSSMSTPLLAAAENAQPTGIRRWFTRKQPADRPSSSSPNAEADKDSEKEYESMTQAEIAAAKATAEAKKAEKKKFDNLLPMPMSNRKRSDMKLSVVICINGWVAQKRDFLTMWKNLWAPDSDVFTLVWETKELIALNHAIINFIGKQIGQQIGQTVLSKMVLGPLMVPLVPAIVLNTASSLLIDNAWAVMVERSMKAGKLLAHVLMTGCHGDRPVTLIGYSMGARLIFHCLLELCRNNCKGIVEHVVLLGVPVSVRPERWDMARRVVSGRFINGFSRRDWVLQWIYRTSKGFIKAAGGLGPVNLAGIENVNLTAMVDGHFSYIYNVDEIMDLINLFGE